VHNSSNGAPFRNGFDFKVIKGFNDASVFDVLWVRGGDPTALAHLMENRTYLDFLLRQSATGRYVASVCEGALLLAAAGLLDGYMATTHWSFIPCFVERFPQVLIAPGHPRFHLDRNRLTGGRCSR
jgi:transcriptional regulator GlxA family with amidase domain